MSKRTRANFMVAEKLRIENQLLRRQINWLLCQIKYCNDNPYKDYSHYGCCAPDCTEDGCEFTLYDGITDRPDCRKCWLENLRRNTE